MLRQLIPCRRPCCALNPPSPQSVSIDLQGEELDAGIERAREHVAMVGVGVHLRMGSARIPHLDLSTELGLPVPVCSILDFKQASVEFLF